MIWLCRHSGPSLVSIPEVIMIMHPELEDDIGVRGDAVIRSWGSSSMF
jgi:hypothetical protein